MYELKQFNIIFELFSSTYRVSRSIEIVRTIKNNMACTVVNPPVNPPRRPLIVHPYARKAEVTNWSNRWEQITSQNNHSSRRNINLVMDQVGGHIYYEEEKQSIMPHPSNPANILFTHTGHE
jgi:hypothetical protein